MKSMIEKELGLTQGSCSFHGQQSTFTPNPNGIAPNQSVIGHTMIPDVQYCLYQTPNLEPTHRHHLRVYQPYQSPFSQDDYRLRTRKDLSDHLFPAFFFFLAGAFLSATSLPLLVPAISSVPATLLLVVVSSSTPRS